LIFPQILIRQMIITLQINTMDSGVVCLMSSFFIFTPAEDINFIFSAYYDEYSDGLTELKLYEKDTSGRLLGTNLNVPYATGRRASAISQRGEVMPDHANWFTYKVNKGKGYALKVSPDETRDIGKTFTLKIEVRDGWISVPGLWGLFIGMMLFLIILRGIIRFFTMNKRSAG